MHIQLSNRQRRIRQAGIVTMASIIGVALTATPVSASQGYLQTTANNLVASGYPATWIRDTREGSAAAGFANIDPNNQQAAAANLHTRIGSVTKSFVSAVTLQLVDENSLGLDDTVEQHLPGLLPYGSSVTIRQLLQHTSGVPDYLESGTAPLFYEFIRKSVPGNPEYDPSFKNTSWTPQQLVSRVAGEPQLILPPNQASYSNTNYIVLGMIIQDVTGQTLRHEVQHRIIGPLNLSHTSFPTTNKHLQAPYAHGYTYNLDEFGAPVVGTKYDLTNYDPSFLWAAGGMTSNTADLNKFMRALIGGQLLSASLTTQMKQAVPFNFPIAGVGSGLGIWVWDLSVDPNINGCNKTIYGHEGEVPGYNTFAFSNGSGSRSITLANNLLVPDWDNQFFATALPGYVGLWCHNN